MMQSLIYYIRYTCFMYFLYLFWSTVFGQLWQGLRLIKFTLSWFCDVNIAFQRKFIHATKIRSHTFRIFKHPWPFWLQMPPMSSTNLWWINWVFELISFLNEPLIVSEKMSQTFLIKNTLLINLISDNSILLSKYGGILSWLHIVLWRVMT